jgi:hypothetical protein
VVALSLEPLPIWIAQRRDPALRRVPTVAVRDGLVLHANPPARRLGVDRGMRVEGARLRAPHLVVLEPGEPELAQAWHEVLRELSGWTPWLDGRRRGFALLRLHATEAQTLVAAFEGRVGVAADRQTAELAAAAARPGEARTVSPGDEDAFLARLPLRFLRAIGLGEADLTRLHWLGLATVGDLARWSAAQLRAYLGEAGRGLLPYLHGPRQTSLPTWAAPPVLRRHLSFEQPLFEPGEVEGAVDHLARSLTQALAGRVARRLTVVADVGARSLPATRLAKRPLSAAGAIRRQALLALRDTGALPQGIEGLALELAESARWGEQEGLWATHTQRERACDAVAERFPASLVRVRWGDPYAPAVDHAWRWVPLDEEGGTPAEAGREPAEAVPLFAAEPGRALVSAEPEIAPRAWTHPDAPARGPLVRRPLDVVAADLERFERPPGERGRGSGRVLRAA